MGGNWEVCVCACIYPPLAIFRLHSSATNSTTAKMSPLSQPLLLNHRIIPSDRIELSFPHTAIKRGKVEWENETLRGGISFLLFSWW